MAQYSKYNIVYQLQKWMDSVAGQTFMNYAYSWGASIVILGALFKLTHLPGANLMLFLGMGTEAVVFFISAFDRPFDKTQDGMELPTSRSQVEEYEEPQDSSAAQVVVIGGGADTNADAPQNIVFASQQTTTPAPAVSQETAEAMEQATTTYVERLNELNEMLLNVAAQSKRITTDSEEMENLNRTLTGIARVYEMQLKSASQQIGTIDEINAKTKDMVAQIDALNKIYARMVEAMSLNAPGAH